MTISGLLTIQSSLVRISQLVQVFWIKLIYRTMTDMGVQLSLVFPALPVLVGYMRGVGKNGKLRVPLHAWAMTCQDSLLTHPETWRSQAKKDLDINVKLDPSLPDSLAFPRALEERRLNTTPAWSGIEKGRYSMGLFIKDDCKAEMRTGELRRTLLFSLASLVFTHRSILYRVWSTASLASRTLS